MLNVAVEKFLETEKGRKGAQQYIFHIVNVPAGEQVDGRDCWKLVFVPGDKVPGETAKRLAVWVDKEQGWPRKVAPIKAMSDASVQRVGEAFVIVDAPDGIPLEVIPPMGEREFRSETASLNLRQRRQGTETFMELAYSLDGRESVRIRQRWADGEGWWRYYEKHVDGRLVLRARVYNLPPLEDAFAKVDLLPPKIGTPLRDDKRLWALVKVEPKGPSVAHVLERVRAATGLDFRVAPELDAHEPDLGYISPHPRGYFAWQLLEHLAKKQLDNGRWEKTESGYQLLGVSTALRPTPPSFPWLRVGVGILVLVLVGGALWLYGRRAPKATA